MIESKLSRHTQNKIHHLVEAQSKKNPQKIAIVFYGQKISYGELNAKANQFARYLIDHNVKPGDVVPIILDKSPKLLIAILGILKAGAAYSPLNTDSPNKHIEAVVKETRAKCVCTESGLVGRFAFNKDILVMKLDDMDKEISHYSQDDIDDVSMESDLAYIIYTSGTTGNPKGGMVAHANLLPTYNSWKEAYFLTDADVHLQMAPVGFDVFAGDWIRALCSGGTLVLCPKGVLIDPKKLYQLIEQEKINCAEFVPAILRQLVSYVEKNHYDLSQFRLLVCGSDQWTMGEYRAVRKLCGKDSRLISSYGLTETAIDSSFYEEEPMSSLDDKSMVPIGKPFKHVNIYLVDDDKLAVFGEMGEIYIGGSGVGQGYLNQPKLTAEKFVIRVLKNGTSEKLYRTGDQGKMLADGNFLFLGRNQEHIKIHGKRVDLPSLEAVINQHQKIKFAIVIPTVKTGSDEIILECFFTANDDSLTFDEIANYIKSELPCYYVPRKFHQVETIPLSLNGKVDRRIFSQKVIKELRPEFQQPQDEIQEYLINLWKDTLGVKEVGIKNSFYDLGGSSLLFVAMLEKVNKQFGINIQATVEFETVLELAKYIEKEKIPLTKNSRISGSTNLCYFRPHTRSYHSGLGDAFSDSKHVFSSKTPTIFKSREQPHLEEAQRKGISSSFFRLTSPRSSLSPRVPEAARVFLSLAFRKGR